MLERPSPRLNPCRSCPILKGHRLQREEDDGATNWRKEGEEGWSGPTTEGRSGGCGSPWREAGEGGSDDAGGRQERVETTTLSSLSGGVVTQHPTKGWRQGEHNSNEYQG